VLVLLVLLVLLRLLVVRSVTVHIHWIEAWKQRVPGPLTLLFKPTT
jgi:hypothetical protein